MSLSKLLYYRRRRSETYTTGDVGRVICLTSVGGVGAVSAIPSRQSNGGNLVTESTQNKRCCKIKTYTTANGSVSSTNGSAQGEQEWTVVSALVRAGDNEIDALVLEEVWRDEIQTKDSRRSRSAIEVDFRSTSARPT